MSFMWSGIAAAGAAVIGGVMQADAARDAAESQEKMANRANDVQLMMFNQQREDTAPWRAAGSRALSGMESQDFQRDFSMNDFQADPGYGFRLAEGNKAINSAAAARGMGNSGATMKALLKYGQDYGTQEYQNAYNRFNNDRTNRFNRLASLAGLGQTSNGQMMQASQNYGNQVGNNMMGIGNARAAGAVGQANAWSNALGGATNSWMNAQMGNAYLQNANKKGS